MKKTFVSLLVAGIVSFAGISLAAQNSSDVAVVKVPFQFVVGDKLLPAGTYRVSAQASDWSVVMITSVDKPVAVFASTEGINNPVPGGSNAILRFNNYYGHFFLQQVALPGRDARQVLNVTKEQAERTLTKLNLMPAERAEVAK